MRRFATSLEQSSSLPKKLPFFKIKLRSSSYPCQLFFKALISSPIVIIFSSKTNCFVTESESITLENAEKDILAMYFSDKRYDLGDVGRYKINKKFNFPITTY